MPSSRSSSPTFSPRHDMTSSYPSTASQSLLNTPAPSSPAFDPNSGHPQLPLDSVSLASKDASTSILSTAPDGTPLPPNTQPQTDTPTSSTETTAVPLPTAAPPRKPPTKRARFISDTVGYALVDATEYLQLKRKAEPPPYIPPGGFPFLSLPVELRLHVLSLLLLLPEPIDSDYTNVKTLVPRLRILQTCRQLHDEAARVFYGWNTFRLFPRDGLPRKYILLQRLPQRYRALLTQLELRLGPGWGRPPKCWALPPKVRLPECVNVWRIKVFIEVDPSGEIFRGFRKSEDFYTGFSAGLLGETVAQLSGGGGQIREVEIDAEPSVERRGALVSALVSAVEDQRMKLTWGRRRGYAQEIELERMLGILSLG